MNYAVVHCSLILSSSGTQAQLRQGRPVKLECPEKTHDFCPISWLAFNFDPSTVQRFSPLGPVVQEPVGLTLG